jgi:hypothetical protein
MLNNLPLIFHPSDATLCVKRASYVSGLSDRVVRRLCREYRISQQVSPSASIRIHAAAFLMLVHGDEVALELLRGGERNHASVVRYFQAVREIATDRRSAA